jgi:VanZ family protein
VPVRIATWCALLMIIFLSVVPGNLRPHVIADKHIEHFAAYFITGCLSALAYPRPRQLFLSCPLLSACAAILELVQLEIPGRTSSITDFTVSTCGACLGPLLTFILKQVWVMVS